MNYKVTCGPLEVVLAADNKDHAFNRSLVLFQIKYPNLQSIDTDDLRIEEVPE